MGIEISKDCCGENFVVFSGEVEKTLSCPVCEQQGIHVKNITIRHMVLDDLTIQVGDYDYFSCMNEECEIAYFNNESGTLFTKKQIRVPIWFKNDANPKYACYCSEVTDQQIINAVLLNGATNMKDVLRITGAMNNSKCEQKNPLGKCCHQTIQTLIDKALSNK